LPLACHVGSPDDRKKLIESASQKFGKIDALVSNAAANPFFGPTLQGGEMLL